MAQRDGKEAKNDDDGQDLSGVPPEKPTLFNESETITIALQIVHLIELLHKHDIVHTNLNPDTILLREGDYNKMCFRDLYHCSWNTRKLLKDYSITPDLEDNISLLDTRTRNRDYLSPEQL
mgnify:CR=1 FL=1